MGRLVGGHKACLRERTGSPHYGHPLWLSWRYREVIGDVELELEIEIIAFCFTKRLPPRKLDRVLAHGQKAEAAER